MAIEDGYVLAACLAKYADDPAAAFARYEAIRCERTATVVRKSHEMRGQAFSPALAEANPQDAMATARDWQQVRAKERLEWLYAYDATAVEI
jgi:salicylate hydroxylase